MEAHARASASPPEGFVPHTRRSPLTEPWEPLYARTLDDRVQLAVELRRPHTNSRGLVHGGLIATLADNAMGLSCGQVLQNRHGTRPQSIVTASLSVDYLGKAQLGQWLIVDTDFVRTGRSLCFTQCFVTADGEIIARANASFRI